MGLKPTPGTSPATLTESWSHMSVIAEVLESYPWTPGDSGFAAPMMNCATARVLMDLTV